VEPICKQESVDMPRFEVQEHYARTHHFDFRLEKDGVLKSWAVPKGPPEQPGIKRLCIQVGDHDLSFLGFEGEIPKGDYGAGQITVWDHGYYETDQWTDDLITFTLHGNRLFGEFQLMRFKHGKLNEWLIFMSRTVQQPHS
jgi:bifunctional non-homologous end joining protein LigD